MIKTMNKSKCCNATKTNLRDVGYNERVRLCNNCMKVC